MTGLEAISHHNGWQMAALGITIVFTGLTLLSLAISQLHKVLYFWEHRQEYIEKWRGGKPEVEIDEELAEFTETGDFRESIRQFKLLGGRLGDPFALPRLLELAEKCGLYRPHSTINNLIRAGMIIPDNDGYYTWRKTETDAK